MSFKTRIGVLLGDATGIGPEIICKSLNDPEIYDLARWVVIGDERVFLQGQKIAGSNIPYKKVASYKEVLENNSDKNLLLIDMENLDPNDYEFGQVSEVTGKAMEESFRAALDLVDKKVVDGIVYGPSNKEAMQRAGIEYKDEIQYFTKLTGGKNEISLFSSLGKIWAIRVTNHLPLKDVSAAITRESILETIQVAYDNLIRAGYDNPKIYVTALNPHAGEGGMTGREEVEIIKPAIEEARNKKIDAEGPYPACTVFLRAQQKDADCVINMYHDQSQIGLKLLGFDQGVTIVLGLPVPFTTPAHGTAFGKAGKGTANPSATKEAFKMVVRMAGLSNKN